MRLALSLVAALGLLLLALLGLGGPLVPYRDVGGTLAVLPVLALEDVTAESVDLPAGACTAS